MDAKPDKSTMDEDLALLGEAIQLADTGEELNRFLRDLLTPGEIKTLAERWRVARLLDEGGKTYREISEATGASTTTVTRVARFLSQEPWRGYRTILDRVKGQNS
ncbi:YerC/YecD family TrpR-related protein [Maricaulis sp. CAU 1757]